MATIDWSQVAQVEPHNVVDWFLYLNHRDLISEAEDLIREVENAIQIRPMQSAVWAEYAHHRLPSVLLDILSGPDMFSRDDGGSKSVRYSCRILLLLWACLRMTTILPLAQDADDKQCRRAISDRMERFSAAMWKHRSLLESQRDVPRLELSELDASDPAHFNAFIAFDILRIGSAIYETEVGETITMATHVAHYLLYLWTYSPSRSGWQDQAMQLIYRIFEQDFDTDVQDFVRDAILACHKDYPLHIIQKMAEVMQDRRTLGRDAAILMDVCNAVLVYSGGVLANVNVTHKSIPEGMGLVPSFLRCGQRQLCTSAPIDARECVRWMFRNLQDMMADVKIRRVVEAQVDRYAAKYNLPGMISLAIFEALETEDTTLCLDLLTIYVPSARRVTSNVKHLTEELKDTFTSVQSIWHETLDGIYAFKRKSKSASIAVQQDVQKILYGWRNYGAIVGVAEGVGSRRDRFLSSTPSDETAYWRIPKRCFSKAY
ncbi:hypothetical protein EIP91_006094 [Steccherinum ochraceum]|uniref:Uncharacterized protein n=1 Tax=Steccherinum ochraceum TaxID=92696 RepID=A0A4R0R6G9_9APHY|nr:hypothetical protein EIP91_006094 [Steccherinum ochraceum]